MSNDVNNLAHSFVAMAQAFEQLPVVKAELERTQFDLATANDTIQNLQLRIIDLKNEADEARQATRKAEVERDHAETMFLETDQRLDALRNIIGSFKGNVDAWTAASKPQPIADVAETARLEAVREVDWELKNLPPQEVNQAALAEPAEPQGQREPDPTNEAASPSTTDGTTTATDATNASEGVSVPADPTSANTTEQSADASDHTASPADANMLTPPAPADDVGYHNEPDIASNDWPLWYDRMNARYGDRASWPDREPLPTGWPNSQT